MQFQQMQQPQRAPIFVDRFFTKYKPDPADPARMIGVDYATYGSPGEIKATTTERISRLAAVDEDPENENIGVRMARIRWEAIRPQYEAWKEGREAPIDGTPLAAWNLLQVEEADLLRSKRIRCVEDVAALSGEQIRALGLPNGHEIVRQAKAFVESLDATRGAAVIDSLTAKNEELTARLEAQAAEMAEFRAMLEAQTAPDADDDEEVGGEPPRRRGRPSNADLAARTTPAAA